MNEKQILSYNKNTVACIHKQHYILSFDSLSPPTTYDTK